MGGGQHFLSIPFFDFQIKSSGYTHQTITLHTEHENRRVGAWFALYFRLNKSPNILDAGRPRIVVW